MSAVEVKIKGAAALTTRDWLDQRLGEGWTLKAIRKRAPRWPEQLNPREWYDLRPQLEVIQRAAFRLRETNSVEAVTREIWGLIALKDLTTTHRAFLWANDPTAFLRSVPTLWEAYARFGKVVIEKNEPGEFVAQITDVPLGVDEWVCGAWLGLFPAALIFAGGDDPKAEIGERSRSIAGAWTLRYTLSYGLSSIGR